MRLEDLGLLLDQNVPYETTIWLANFQSIRVEHVYDVGLGGASDSEVFRFAQERHSIVVTYDEDFGDQRIFPIGTHWGIIRLRVQPTTVEETVAALDRLLRSYTLPQLTGKLVIVQRSRIRTLPSD